MKSLLTMQGMMFLMILIGAGMRKIQIVTTEGRRSMTNLVVNLILPSNILYAFSKADASAFRSMLVVVAMAFLIQLAWYLLSRVLWRGMDESRRERTPPPADARTACRRARPGADAAPGLQHNAQRRPRRARRHRTEDWRQNRDKTGERNNKINRDMKKGMKYEEAMRELEQIVTRMENGEPDIDTLAAQLKTAQELIKYCKDKLTKTDEEIKKILENKE